ncbi:MAG: PAS domain-containing protein [Paracoccaceae bacterium]
MKINPPARGFGRIGETAKLGSKNLGHIKPDPSHLEALEGITFLTDRDGVITAIGARNWDAFCNTNGAPDLTANTVIGRSLFDYISGKPVRALFRQALDKLAKAPDASWIMPFRCDAPGRQRNMRQSVTPIFRDGRCTGFFFQSIELTARERPPIELFDFKEMARKAANSPDQPLIKMCSWCQKVRFQPVTGSDWVEAEDYYAAGGPSNVRITHGICEPCAETAGSSKI